MMKKFLSLLVCCLLSACQTSQDTVLQQTKKISAAKINDRLGMAYLERHDILRAKQKFLLALEQAPHIPEPWYSMAYFLETTGNKDQARKYYLKAISLAPERGDALNNYGTFLCRGGEYKTAIHYFMKAAQDPSYLAQGSAYENAGLCSLKIPDVKNATAYFKKALAEDPERSNALIELAELNFRKGDFKSARSGLDKFLLITSPSVQSFLLEKKLDKKLRA